MRFAEKIVLRTLKRTQPSEQTPVDAETKKVLGETSLTSIIFLFQLLMGFAITNGAFIFVTGGTGTYQLKSLTAYSLQEVFIFLAFLFTAIKFAHGLTMYLTSVYCTPQGGFRQKKLRPLVDFLLVFSQAGIFYYLSHTLMQIKMYPLAFFEVLGVFFFTDIVWSIIALLFATSSYTNAKKATAAQQDKTPQQGSRNKRMLLSFIILNSIAVICGALVLLLQVLIPHISSFQVAWLLLVILFLRNFVDYFLTYEDLFPDNGLFSDIPETQA